MVNAVAALDVQVVDRVLLGVVNRADVRLQSRLDLEVLLADLLTDFRGVDFQVFGPVGESLGRVPEEARAGCIAAAAAPSIFHSLSAGQPVGRSAPVAGLSAHANAVILAFKGFIRDVIIDLVVRVGRAGLAVAVMAAVLFRVKVIHNAPVSVRSCSQVITISIPVIKLLISLQCFADK